MHTLQDLKLIKHASYINGEWYLSKRYFKVYNPATGECLAKVCNAGITASQLAVQAGKAAFKDWSAKTASERALLLRRWYALIIENQADLARILTLEQGKPLSEANAEIAYGAGYIEWFSEEAKRVYGDTIPAPSNEQRLMVIKQPIGVASAITPWNFPHAMIARKAAAALAAGCTFIVRPATQTPLSALALAELAERAGMPAGVFNVVVGDDAQGIGRVLTQHQDVAKFTFTGSTATGKVLISQCASTVKKVSMELGGNAPFIVFADADIDAAVAGAVASKFRNAGQTCVCTNRFLIQESVLAEFTEKFVRAVKTLVLGNGLDDKVSLGPMISAQAVNGVQQLVDDAINRGAKVLLAENSTTLGANYLSPIVLTKVTNDMPIAQQEVFAPVASIISFKEEAEAIALANDTDVGLAAYFYSRDIGRIWRVAEGLEFGMVGINEAVISNPAAPFGGMKQSGNGREGSYYGLDDYLEIKYLCMGGITN